MSDLILLYILGALINCWFICTWFFTSLPLHLFKPFIKKEAEVYSWEDWNVWLMFRSEFWAELLGCPLCLGFWVAMAIGGIVTTLNSLGTPFMLACGFSHPFISFVAYKLLEKE